MINLIWFLIAIFLILIVAIVRFLLMKKYKAMVVGIIVFITLSSALIYYITNQTYIESYISSRDYYRVYDSEQNTEIDFIKLPSGSVWLFKTPTDIFYNKRNCKKCIEYFSSELDRMKREGKIDNYQFDKSDNKFTIDVNGHESAEIVFIGDTDQRRYGILYNY